MSSVPISVVPACCAKPSDAEPTANAATSIVSPILICGFIEMLFPRLCHSDWVGQRDGFLSQTPRRNGANHRVIRGNAGHQGFLAESDPLGIFLTATSTWPLGATDAGLGRSLPPVRAATSTPSRPPAQRAEKKSTARRQRRSIRFAPLAAILLHGCPAFDRSGTDLRMRWLSTVSGKPFDRSRTRNLVRSPLSRCCRVVQ